ncbi:MAG: hypothetical protein RJA77_708 [Pseudomonadota bacterium]
MASMRRAVHGVLVADKPRGPSSTQFLGRVRYLYSAAKAGHGGTLDPMATGLLPILLGDATKFAQEGLDADKAYEAEVLLGQTTNTADAEGEVRSVRPVTCTPAEIQSALSQFEGQIEQCPPMYSALKVQGRPLYAYARSGETIERKKRPVTIHRIELLACTLPRITLRVDCSKGTYIRTLAEDLGEALGSGAHLDGLRRTLVGPLTNADAHSLEDIEGASPEVRDAWLKPVDYLIQDWPSVTLADSQSQRFLHGNPVETHDLSADPGGRHIRVMSSHQNFLGVGVFRAGQLHQQRLLSQLPTP